MNVSGRGLPTTFTRQLKSRYAVLGYVGNTDHRWFSFLRDQQLDEVNFWQPRGGRGFHVIKPGAPFFFKLKSPHNAIGGFGFFAHHTVLPAWLAWETFGTGNGAPDFPSMRRSIERLRRIDPVDRLGAYEIGCIVVTGCVFFADDEWVPVPRDFAKNIVQGKSYDITAGEGARLWAECRERLAMPPSPDRVSDAARPVATERYGRGSLVRPRLGQGAFRVAVLDAYGRACAVSSEHSLPVLEAAHIQSYASGGHHEVSNGICLRSDIHRLFDAGYVTVDGDHRFVVSRRLKDDYDNGRVYYAWQGRSVEVPRDRTLRPDPAALAWHRDNLFIG